MGRLIIVLLFLVHMHCKISAQHYDSDFKLLNTSDTKTKLRNNKKSFINYFPPYWVYKFSKKVIKPQLSADDRYAMPLREFSKGSFNQYGPIKGFFMAVDRINRTGRLGYVDFPPVRTNADGTIIDLPKYYQLR